MVRGGPETGRPRRAGGRGPGVRSLMAVSALVVGGLVAGGALVQQASGGFRADDLAPGVAYAAALPPPGGTVAAAELVDSEADGRPDASTAQVVAVDSSTRRRLVLYREGGDDCLSVQGPTGGGGLGSIPFS